MYYYIHVYNYKIFFKQTKPFIVCVIKPGGHKRYTLHANVQDWSEWLSRVHKYGGVPVVMEMHFA